MKQVVRKSSSERGRNRLCKALMDSRLTIREFSQRTGISVSAIEKFRMGHLVPAENTVEKIEAALSTRIWSSPVAYRERLAVAHFKSTIAAIVRAEGVDEAAAQAIALSRFPHLAIKTIYVPIQK